MINSKFLIDTPLNGPELDCAKNINAILVIKFSLKSIEKQCKNSHPLRPLILKIGCFKIEQNNSCFNFIERQ